MNKTMLLLGVVAISLSSCVSKKKFAELQAENEKLQAAGPVNDAREAMKADRVAVLEGQVKDLRMRLEAEAMQAKELNRLMEASELPQPTPEQMRAYELQAMAKMEELERPGEMEPPSMGEEGSLKETFDQGNFGIRLIVKPMREALKSYSDNQVQYASTPGRSVVAISNKELFVEGEAELSAIGRQLLDKMILSFESQQPVDFDLVAVTKSTENEDAALAIQRINNIKNYIVEAEGKPQIPGDLSVVNCDQAYGPKRMNCGRVEFVFGMEYNKLMQEIEQEVK